ncbi:unnamed protein product [Cylindrotheca closterium]|uniref:Uncharacterized protein n=1 Tax=Cylindrotheca closterium TaxID=2856 RepID=A0AAD2PVJ4_9STRA|nr:unnamed protein product [Cylindrotheca closterium]
MLQSLIALQAILANVNSGAVLSRSLSSSTICATTTTTTTTVLANNCNRVIAIEDEYSNTNGRSHPATATGRFSQPYAAGPPLNFPHQQQQRNYFDSPLGWTRRRVSSVSFTSRSSYSTASSQPSPSSLFASRGGGRGDGSDADKDDESKLNFSTDEHQENIELPFRKYGYRSTPFSWDELDQIVVKEQNLAKLSRSVAQEQEYQRALVKLKREWKSTKDYILYSKFNLPKQFDEETQLYFVDEMEQAASTANGQDQEHPPQPLLRLVPNDYPYYCAPGIEHWVLWKYGTTNSMISSEEIDWAKKSLLQQHQQQSGDGMDHDDDDDGRSSSTTGATPSIVTTTTAPVDPDMIAWENPPALKSLPEINHVHILLRHISKE